MSDSLYVRDGNGILKELEVISGSTTSRFVPIHALTGSISTVLSSTDLASLTGSINAVSSAIGTFNQQLYQALSGGPVSMSVDIVAGDVNTITGSVDKVTAEIAKLTALSNSSGLLMRGNVTASVTFPATQSVSLVNTGSLTASISNWPTITDYAINAGQQSYSYTQLTASADSFVNPTGKGYIIYNNTNNNLYLLINSSPISASTTIFSYIIDQNSVYESLPIVSHLTHSIILHPSTSVGTVSRTNLS